LSQDAFNVTEECSYQQFHSTELLEKPFSPYFHIVSMKGRRDDVSTEDDLDSTEVMEEENVYNMTASQVTKEPLGLLSHL